MIVIKNNSEYPTREVKKLVRQALGYNDITTGISVDVRHFVKKTGCGQERTWMGGWYAAGRRSILAKIVKPGWRPYIYDPYDRKRGTCPSFPLNDWREQLVALVAHEGQHHRQWLANERYVENDCDLAAYRAVTYYREDLA
jgi:hypothetical protein